MELLKPLTEDILKGKTIVLTIVASVAENSELRGYAVVIISLPETENEVVVGKRIKLVQRLKNSLIFLFAVPPSFTKPYYNGTYTVSTNDGGDDELSVEDISIDDNGVESIVVTILEEGDIVSHLHENM